MNSGDPPWSGARLTSAPRSRHSRIVSTWPPKHAVNSGVAPQIFARLTSAPPRSSSGVAMSRWPTRHATKNGVLLSSGSASSALAPASRHRRASMTLPAKIASRSSEAIAHAANGRTRRVCVARLRAARWRASLRPVARGSALRRVAQWRARPLRCALAGVSAPRLLHGPAARPGARRRGCAARWRARAARRARLRVSPAGERVSCAGERVKARRA